MANSNRPSINLPKYRPSSNNYNPTGLLIHNEASMGKIAESVAFMEVRNDLNVQQVVKTELNVSTPNTSIKSYFSNFFGDTDEKKGANLYTYSEISNLCEPPPSRYENLPNKDSYQEVFCTKSFIPDSKAVSTLKPNDVVTGKFRNESEQSDFLPLDMIGSILAQIEQDANTAASEAFEGAQQAQQLSQTPLSEDKDCTPLVGTDFEKFLEPCDGSVGSRFGPRNQPAGANKGKIIFHPGQDVGIGQGKPVYAMYDGKVVTSKKAEIQAELSKIEKAKKEGKASEDAARLSAKVFGIVRIQHTIVNGLPGVFVDNYSSYNVVQSGKGTLNDGGRTELKAGTYYTQYTHLSAVYVNYGQQVTSGTLIGLIGGMADPYIPGTGRDKSGKPLSTGPHLHFELLDEKERRIDPVEVLKWGKSIKAGARCKTLDNPPKPMTETQTQAEIDAVAAKAIEQADKGLLDLASETASQLGDAVATGSRKVFNALNPFD